MFAVTFLIFEGDFMNLLLKALFCSLIFVGFVNATEPAAPPPATPPALININTADAVTLATLTGINIRKAEDIIKYRQANGGFKTVEELGNIHGIGKKTLDTNRARLTVGDVKMFSKPADSNVSKPIDNKPLAPNTTNGLMPKM
jgi:competence protein ComEA